MLIVVLVGLYRFMSVVFGNRCVIFVMSLGVSVFLFVMIRCMLLYCVVVEKLLRCVVNVVSIDGMKCSIVMLCVWIVVVRWVGLWWLLGVVIVSFVLIVSGYMNFYIDMLKLNGVLCSMMLLCVSWYVCCIYVIWFVSVLCVLLVFFGLLVELDV